MQVLEKQIQLSVMDYAVRKYGMEKIKLTTLGRFGTSGWPDYLILYRGRVMFIEFKSLKGEVTPLQAEKHQRLRVQGFLVNVINSVPAGKALIDQFARSK